MSNLITKGITAASICGGDEDQFKQDGVHKGHYQIVYFTPEILILNRIWRRMLTTDVYQENLKALVVDEAHCVQKWWVLQNLLKSCYNSCLPTVEKHLGLHCYVLGSSGAYCLLILV